MITLRLSRDRGCSTNNWLKSYHTFSFADYYNPHWIEFGDLRVINEDYIAPGQGFGFHAHQDMEIITYVVDGVLKHQDSMGNGSNIVPGEIQRMSAGTGIQHSEFNGNDKESLHLLQIWILPSQKGITPDYEQKKIHWVPNDLTLIGSDHPTQHAVTIHQDLALYAGRFFGKQQFTYALNQRRVWLQLIKGELKINQNQLHAGDGIGFQKEEKFIIESENDIEFLLFDIP